MTEEQLQERLKRYAIERINEANKEEEDEAELGELKVVCGDEDCQTSFDPFRTDGICPECEGVY